MNQSDIKKLQGVIAEHWPTIRKRLDARSKPAAAASDALQKAFERAGLVTRAGSYTEPGKGQVAPEGGRNGGDAS